MCRVLSATRNTSESPKMLKTRQRPLECPGGEAARGQLEEKLHCKLYKPRVPNLRDLPKMRPVRNIAVRIEELRMVEDVEELSPESTWVFSVIGMVLRIAQSVLLRCGPQQIVRFVFPSVPKRDG